MTIVTKTGDKGQTGLVGGVRVSKADARIHAYGTVDELNALLGVVLAEGSLPVTVQEGLGRIQHQLFTLGADLATPMDSTVPTKRITAAHVEALEQWIAELERELPVLQQFILPGGTKNGAHLHLARTVCRRAERWMTALQDAESANPQALIYANRLGDLLFLAARAVNRHEKRGEEAVQYA